MRRFIRWPILLLLVALVALGIVGSRFVPGAQGAAPALVKTAAAHILVTNAGKTLYVFSLDKKGASACTGKCATFWPPLTMPMGSKMPAMSGMMGKFGETMRKDGTAQLTYDGAPLYMFASDKKAGDMLGQGLGGTWWAVAVPGM